MAVVDVIVALGQSNMEGEANVSGLPVSLTGPQAGRYIYNHTADAIETLDVDTGNNMTFPPGTVTHGPEMTLAEAAYDALGEIYLYKYAIDGTSLGPGTFYSWHPNMLPAANNLFENFKTFFALFVAQLALAGDTPNVKFVTWFQGEADAVIEGLDESYYGALKHFVNKVRIFLADYSTASIIPWVTCVIHKGIVPPGFTYLVDRVNNVRSAQFRAGWSDPYYRIVDTDRFTHAGDNLHLDSAGQQACGTAIWDAFMLPRNNS